MMSINIAAVTLVAICLCATSYSFVIHNAPKECVGSLNAYVPDGLTAAEYQKIKPEDKKKLGKQLGKLGPRGFQSSSIQAWQEAFERDETGHLFAPVGYQKKLLLKES
jgi:hypothetical protein